MPAAGPQAKAGRPGWIDGEGGAANFRTDRCNPAGRVETNGMSMTPIQMDIYRSAIPMRSFKHAAAERSSAEAILVHVGFADGTDGWGETLPRPYVTGETLESVIDDLTNIIWPRWAGVEMPSDPAAEIAEPIHNGRCINAAIAAFDLATLGRLAEDFDRLDGEALAPLTGRAQVRRTIDARVSGVIGINTRRKVKRKFQLMKWIGIEDYKLKLSGDEQADASLIQIAHQQLGRLLSKRHATLRVDVNGGWPAEAVVERVAAMKAWGVCAVEQPTYCSADKLLTVARDCALPLIADESLLTAADGDILAAEPEKIWWNIRISKNGGMVNTLKLARQAAGCGAPFILGCMVGETGLLSGAQRRFLQLGAGPRFIEGNYGTFLLKDDLTDPRLRFGYGGRISLRKLKATPLGVTVDPSKLARYAIHIKTLS